MIYINAKRLIESAIQSNVLKTMPKGSIACEPDGQYAIIPEDMCLIYYMKDNDQNIPEGWRAIPTEQVIHDIMDDKEGQKLLIETLKENNALPIFMHEGAYDNGDQEFLDRLEVKCE